MSGYDLWFDDFKLGDEFVTPALTITESAIIDFALTWDPQAHHIDATHERTEMLGGLMASGFHTLTASFRLFLGSGVLAASNLTSPGMDKLRWIRPVRAGDTLHMVAKVVATHASASKPDRGVITMEHVTFNQKGEPVLSVECAHFLKRRPGAA